MQMQIISRGVGGVLKRVSALATLVAAFVVVAAVAPAQAQYAYNWNAEEYLLTYGNAGFVTFKFNYNLITYNGTPTQEASIKILNKGSIAGKVNNVQFSDDRIDAILNASGVYSYTARILVNGRWTYGTKKMDVNIVAKVHKTRERAALVGLVITGPNGETIYDSNGYFSWEWYTLMK
ncbi:MAG TPA: hypothetical protein VNJ09_04360 [Chthonomonadales bacterium]|nr:hypothetical protein [Chthonomonadales bacterium]